MKTFVVGALCTIIGGTCGWFVSKRFYQNRRETLSQRDTRLDAEREERKRLKEEQEIVVSPQPKNPDYNHLKQAYQDGIAKAREKNTSTSEQDYSAPYRQNQSRYNEADSEEDDDPEFELDMEHEAAVAESLKKDEEISFEPVMLSSHEFDEMLNERNDNGYEYVGLTYYYRDDIICDEDENALPNNYEMLLSARAIEELRSGQVSGVYIFNEGLQTLYEVTAIDAAYSVAVLGKLETGKERNIRIKNNKQKRRDRVIDDSEE